MKLVIWGIGAHLQRNIDQLNQDDIECYIDGNMKNRSGEYQGKRVLPPDNLSSIDYDLILVSSVKYYAEIASEMVTTLSVPYSKIVSLDVYLEINKELYNKSVLYALSKTVQRYDHYKYESFFRKPERLISSNTDGFFEKLGLECVHSFDIHYKELKDNNLFNAYGLILKNSVHPIKISFYVVAHKRFHYINDPLYKTIWVGDHQNGTGGDVYDNTGDEISKYNSLINECTALYWMWKNDNESDFIGLNHYRRYFESPINPGCPIQRWEAELMLKECDIVVGESVDLKENNAYFMRCSVGDDAFESSFSVLREIFDRKDNKEKKAFDMFINDSIVVPCQMFIMDRQKLNEYCSWLFPIVFEMIDKIEIKDSWSKYSKRVIGFWAERLFTVWLLFTGYRIEEVPIIKTDDEGPYGQ